MALESFAADVIIPNVDVPNVVPGLLKCGVLVRLKASARNSIDVFSVSGIIRKSEASRFTRSGPVSMLRPTLPKLVPLGAENGVTSNQGVPALKWPYVSTGPLTFGRLLMKGAFRPALLYWKLSGLPVCAVMTPFTCHPPATQAIGPLRSQWPPFPKGS